MKPWIYCQEPAQLHDGRVLPEWKAVAAGYLVQVLGSPDLYPKATDSLSEWEDDLRARMTRTAAGAAPLPWIAVTQATNRRSGDRGAKGILYHWDNEQAWDGLCQRVRIWADVASAAGAAGLCLDLEDYLMRFNGAPSGWAADGTKVHIVWDRAARWLISARGAGLPISVLDHCSSSWNYPHWKSWGRIITQDSRLSDVRVWGEDTFAQPNQDQAKSLRAGLTTRLRAPRCNVAHGLLMDPVRASKHPLGDFAAKRNLKIWCFPWS